jgi:catalase
MALQFVGKDGQEWRTAMLSAPVFLVSTPAAFLAQLQAGAPDPTTGKPDPAKLAAFFAAHPETQAFRQWASQATPSASFGSTRFNSLNSFQLRNERGDEHYVRWSLINDLSLPAPSAATTENPDYLFDDLQTRLAQGPLTWQLQFQIAQPEDPIADATKAWSAERATINAGQLVITEAQVEGEGACRDINYDPLILPSDFHASADPLLSARSAVYADASRRRLGEHTSQPQHPHPNVSAAYQTNYDKAHTKETHHE